MPAKDAPDQFRGFFFGSTLFSVESAKQDIHLLSNPAGWELPDR
jgi:hypothetical protein